MEQRFADLKVKKKKLSFGTTGMGCFASEYKTRKKRCELHNYTTISTLVKQEYLLMLFPFC